MPALVNQVQLCGRRCATGGRDARRGAMSNRYGAIGPDDDASRLSAFARAISSTAFTGWRTQERVKRSVFSLSFGAGRRGLDDVNYDERAAVVSAAPRSDYEFG